MKREAKQTGEHPLPPINEPNKPDKYHVKQITIIYTDEAGEDHRVAFDREKDGHTFLYNWFQLWMNSGA